MGASIEYQPRLFASLWRYKWYIIAVSLLAASVGYGLSTFQSSLYLADGTVLLKDPRSAGDLANEIGLALDPRSNVRNQAEIMESAQVAQLAAQNLDNGTTPNEVQEATTATATTDLDTVIVAATMPTPDEAVAMVDAAVGAYEEIVTQQIQTSVNASLGTLEASKAETVDRIADLDARIADNPDDSALEAQLTAATAQFVVLDTRIELLATNAAVYGSGVQLYVAPTAPTAPIRPRPRRNAVIAFVIGGLSASTWAWWRAQRNQIVDDHAVPAAILGAPLLASIPAFEPVDPASLIPVDTAKGTGAPEAYQFALSSLRFALEKVNGTTVLITSTSLGEGKSATAINLSIAAAQDGGSLLLIDADGRAQGLTRLSRMVDAVGITDLNGPERIEESVHIWQINGTSLDFVPAGTDVVGNTANFFRSETFQTALASLVDGRDMVIIDSPPVMAAAETTDIGSVVDGIVLVVQKNTSIRELEAAKDRLAISDTPIIGYIFNKATFGFGVKAHSYGYGPTM